ncbi:hypothetical protein BN12_730018 [Nostocoides japonicum T1-X7]|uniref:Recombinase zinc beta ribbon domain-containing protein n=1 Tax=Nostocoides japonicum T1-X7 TaxID=1194083 RepID=A0A077M4T6_9MICO|nr:hypothetical protein BN12_730018 [Tetrasphaera japonica T1-X7]
MQSILDTAKKARARKRIHDHYLKGSLFCGACGARLQLDLPTNKQGIQSAYFSCSGRRTRKTKCTRRAIPVAVAEQLVADCYSRISINEAQYVGLAKKVEQAFDERFAARSDELAELAANRRRLEAESDKLLAAHFADAIDLPTLKRHQDRIRAGLADIDRRITDEHDQDQGPRKQINKALRLLIDCQRLYKTTDAHGKRLANQTFTTGIDIDEDEEATLRLAEPFAATTGQNTHVRSSTTSEIVELRGLEPLTPSMPWRCATSCATAPSFPGGTSRTGLRKCNRSTGSTTKSHAPWGADPGSRCPVTTRRDGHGEPRGAGRDERATVRRRRSRSSAASPDRTRRPRPSGSWTGRRGAARRGPAVCR